MNQKWTIVSLFDGMACGALALQAAGIEIESYDAFEIDKYAIQTAQHNFPFIKHHGDVFKADFTQFKGVDLVCGGSPCTYWSIAQKNNRETEASGMGWELFSQYVRAIKEAEPKYFIYENNKSMSKAIRDSIDKAFGFEAVLINSALVSAQNRQRLYWIGKRNEDGTYSKVNVEQPADRGILLKDILEGGEDLTSNDKAYCLTASYDGACAWNTIERSQRSMVAEPVRIPEYGASDKSRPCEALYANHAGTGEGSLEKRLCSDNPNKQQVDLIAEPVTIEKAIPKIADKLGYVPEMFIAYNAAEITDKAPSLTTGSMVTSSCAVNRFEGVPGYATPCEWDENGRPTKAISSADGKTYAVYEVKDGKITIKGKQYPIKLPDGFYIIRKLTVRECMRLQTVPEWYEFPVSDSRAYQLLGNGWTILIIQHLLESILKMED